MPAHVARVTACIHFAGLLMPTAWKIPITRYWHYK
jgi:hypothetical protein